MTPSLSTLRSLAEAATPGERKTYGTVIWSPSAKAVIAQASELRESKMVKFSEPQIGSKDLKEIYANAAFIAACSPEVILALIGEVEELRARVRLPNNIASWTADFLPHGDTSKVATIQDAFDAMEKMDRPAVLKITTLPKENLDSSVKKQ